MVHRWGVQYVDFSVFECIVPGADDTALRIRMEALPDVPCSCSNIMSRICLPIFISDLSLHPLGVERLPVVVSIFAIVDHLFRGSDIRCRKPSRRFTEL